MAQARPAARLPWWRPGGEDFENQPGAVDHLDLPIPSSRLRCCTGRERMVDDDPVAILVLSINSLISSILPLPNSVDGLGSEIGTIRDWATLQIDGAGETDGLAMRCSSERLATLPPSGPLPRRGIAGAQGGYEHNGARDAGLAVRGRYESFRSCRQFRCEFSLRRPVAGIPRFSNILDWLAPHDVDIPHCL